MRHLLCDMTIWFFFRDILRLTLKFCCKIVLHIVLSSSDVSVVRFSAYDFSRLFFKRYSEIADSPIGI